MPAGILVVSNPLTKSKKRTHARKKRTAKTMAHRRHLTAKQIAAGFGGKRAQSAARRRRSSGGARRRRRASAPRRRVRRNPIATTPVRRRRRSRSANTYYRYARRRSSRAGHMLGGIISRDIIPAAVGGAGALALDMVWPHIPLPAQLQTGPLVPFVRIGGALVIGFVGGMLAGKRFGTMMAIGAMVPTMYDVAKGYMADVLPPPATGTPGPTAGYAPEQLGWISPGRMAGYAPLDGYAPAYQ